ncbi:MAG: hypothetical protein V4724_38190 [Pseudomonadota bacterium]
MPEQPAAPDPAGQETGEDSSGLHARALAWGGAAIVAGIVFAVGAAWLAQDLLRPQGGFGGPNAQGMALPSPALLAAPQPERAAFESDKQHLVSSYGWVDRQAGIARIPVEQAMQLMVERAGGEKTR